MKRFSVISLFPEFVEAFKSVGLLSRAISQAQIGVEAVALRDFAVNTHGQVDDTPSGGGSGMVLRADAAVPAIRSAKEGLKSPKVVVFSARGQTFNQELAKQIAADESDYIFLTPRYEGIDERVIESVCDLELSIGDYVLMGGESAAMVVVEACARLIPGVLGNQESIKEESFSSGLLEYPQYTKPQEYEGKRVPDVLLSGNHAQISKWRRERAEEVTLSRRPDLVSENFSPTCPISVGLIHHPVSDKQGDVITSSITNLDLHDIARSAKTYGLRHFFVAHPVRALRSLASKICEHWSVGFGAEYNPNRKEALEQIKIVQDLDDMILNLEQVYKKRPKLITTSAKVSENSISFSKMRAELCLSQDPYLILLGTGWGLHEEILIRADYHLEPIYGPTPYNHLSVRAAAAIMFDKLFGVSA